MIEVVIPVFNAVAQLSDCLDSVAGNTPKDTRIWIINDASTDPDVGRLLASWTDKAPRSWNFLHNDQNLGFVATANRGMVEASGHVVLLNSDTLVTPGWLRGLNRCLESDARIATSTPWTNNGEIASFPQFCQSNPVPEKLELLAQVLRQHGPAEYPEIPTAVGFCMAIARPALERIGLFDVEQFGRGYGEENDFSRRAVQAGYHNVLCDDVYVAHRGGCSFGPLGLKPGEDSMKRLLQQHPDYLEVVQHFISTDPLERRRRQLALACEQESILLR